MQNSIFAREADDRSTLDNLSPEVMFLLACCSLVCASETAESIFSHEVRASNCFVGWLVRAFIGGVSPVVKSIVRSVWSRLYMVSGV